LKTGGFLSWGVIIAVYGGTEIGRKLFD